MQTLQDIIQIVVYIFAGMLIVSVGFALTIFIWKEFILEQFKEKKEDGIKKEW